MGENHEAVAQLEDELGDLATRVGAVLGADLQLAIIARAQARAGWLVAEMAAGNLAATTVADALNLLWPAGPPPEWWSTPLGLLVAPLAYDDETWSHSEAAAVLGVTRGTVARAVERGNIPKAPTGALPRRAVLARLLNNRSRQAS